MNTQLPWLVAGNAGHIESAVSWDCICKAPDVETAALIVRAVNNYQKLVDALRRIDIELSQHPEANFNNSATPVTYARQISRALLAELEQK